MNFLRTIEAFFSEEGPSALEPIDIATVAKDITQYDVVINPFNSDTGFAFWGLAERYCLQANDASHFEDIQTAINRLITKGSKLLITDAQGNTIFHRLASISRPWSQEDKSELRQVNKEALSKMLEFLIQKAEREGCDWNSSNKYGITPKHLIEAFGYDNLTFFKDTAIFLPDMIDYLIDKAQEQEVNRYNRARPKKTPADLLRLFYNKNNDAFISNMIRYLIQKVQTGNFNWEIENAHQLTPQQLKELFGFNHREQVAEQRFCSRILRSVNRETSNDRFASLANKYPRLGLFMLEALEKKDLLPRSKNVFKKLHFYFRQLILYPEVALFMMAIKYPVIPLAQTLLQKGESLITINMQDNMGKTPLYVAVQSYAYGSNGSTQLEEYICLLLTLGANPNLADVYKFTPIHIVSFAISELKGTGFYDSMHSRLLNLMELLLHFGANTLQIDGSDKNALDYLKSWKEYYNWTAMNKIREHLEQYPDNNPVLNNSSLINRLSETWNKTPEHEATRDAVPYNRIESFS